MPELKLARVEPVRIRTEGARWEQRRGRNPGQQPNRERSQRDRLLASILPDRVPESCELAVDVDRDGTPVGIVVRDISTGQVLARLSNEQLARLNGANPGGLLVERRG